MKLVQFFLPGKGKRVGLIQGDRVLDITSIEEGVGTTLDLVTQGKTFQGMATRANWLARRLRRGPLDWREIQRAPARRVPHLLVPIDTPEVWGFASGDAAAAQGETPAPSSGEPRQRPAPASAGGDRRPALYFKATAHRVVGPYAPIVIRRDSALTVPEAHLAAVLGPAGDVMAFTACNDVTAKDIERAGPEFLGQAKVYAGSCALGPCLVTPDEIEDPEALQMRCSIVRQGKAIFSAAAGTVRPHIRIESLVDWLCRDNPVPAGTTLLVRQGVEVPDVSALSAGDRVDIEVERIGRLSNPVRPSEHGTDTR